MSEDDAASKYIDNDNDDIYTVEKIVKKRVIKGSVSYFVKWKGYSSSENTW